MMPLNDDDDKQREQGDQVDGPLLDLAARLGARLRCPDKTAFDQRVDLIDSWTWKCLEADARA